MYCNLMTVGGCVSQNWEIQVPSFLLAHFVHGKMDVYAIYAKKKKSQQHPVSPCSIGAQIRCGFGCSHDTHLHTYTHTYTYIVHFHDSSDPELIQEESEGFIANPRREQEQPGLLCLSLSAACASIWLQPEKNTCVPFEVRAWLQ